MALPGSATKAAGTGLPVHNGSHPSCNQFARDELNQLYRFGLSPTQAKAALWKLAHNLRYEIAETGSLPVK